MPRRRHARLLAALALAALTSACSGSGPDGTPAAGPAQTAPGNMLLGSVGGTDDPNAFDIALTTQDGEPVKNLKAGAYTLVVQDRSKIHNFVLVGPGVEEATEVAAVGESTFQITLEAGSYDYSCDPHPSMAGGFTVTS